MITVMIAFDLLWLMGVTLHTLSSESGEHADIQPISLAYKTFEPSHNVNENNPIIFLHGLGASKELWRDIPQKIADTTHRKVYALDARNHGDSPWSDQFSLDVIVADLMHFVENLAADKVTVVGHSMGGMTSMKTALKMPSKIDRIIVEDMGIYVPDEIVDVIKFFFSLYHDAVNSIPSGSTKEEAEKFLASFVLERVPDELKNLVNISEYQYQDYLKQNTDGSFTSRSNIKVLIKALQDDSLISKYEGVYDGPTCFIYGEKSPFPVNQDAENIKKIFPNAQFVGIPNATHDVHRDAPEPYIEALLNNLKD